MVRLLPNQQGEMRALRTGLPIKMDVLRSVPPTETDALHSDLPIKMGVLHIAIPGATVTPATALLDRRETATIVNHVPLSGRPTETDVLHIGQPTRMDVLHSGPLTATDVLHSVTPEAMENQEADLPLRRETAITPNRVLLSGLPLQVHDSGKVIHEIAAIGVTGLRNRGHALTQVPPDPPNTVRESRNRPSLA